MEVMGTLYLGVVGTLVVRVGTLEVMGNLYQWVMGTQVVGVEVVGHGNSGRESGSGSGSVVEVGVGLEVMGTLVVRVAVGVEAPEVMGYLYQWVVGTLVVGVEMGALKVTGTLEVVTVVLGLVRI
jgi:hypothetical protein